MNDDLVINKLAVDIPRSGMLKRVLHDVSFSILAGEAVGVIGESGSGKSMTAQTIMRLLPRNSNIAGTLQFAGMDVLSMTPEELRKYRSNSVSMIYQVPSAHVNPVRTIGDFMSEGLRIIKGMSKRLALKQSEFLLEEVGLSNSKQILSRYPHQLSGGMLQRVMIAAALSSEPQLLLADEPTTALDVTNQAEIVLLINNLRKTRNLSLMFVTHDIDLAGAICDRICVMYAGSIVESLPTSQLKSALHPYTRALLRAKPSVEERMELEAVPGYPISGFDAPHGCAFASRCRYAKNACRDNAQVMRRMGVHHWVRCARAPLEDTFRFNQ